jgi:hypothetical protein
MEMMASALIGFTVTLVCAAQTQTKSGSVFLSPGKPGVYITFVRLGVREPMRVGESRQGAFFRLHNNTRWDLLLRMNGVPQRNGEAGGFYSVIEDPNGYPPAALPPGEPRINVSSVNPIQPGNSIEFSVPQEHIGEGLGLQIEFNYEWEARDRPGIPSPNEPTHMVAFYHSQLPASMRRGERRRPAVNEPIWLPPAMPIPSETPKSLDVESKKKQH